MLIYIIDINANTSNDSGGVSTILAKTNETFSMINNLICSFPLTMLIKMSKKPTRSALCHWWATANFV